MAFIESERMWITSPLANIELCEKASFLVLPILPRALYKYVGVDLENVGSEQLTFSRWLWLGYFDLHPFVCISV